MIEYFPEHAETVRRLAATNQDFNELCQDYIEVVETLVSLEGSTDPGSKWSLDEFRRLRTELDEEILEMVRRASGT